MNLHRAFPLDPIPKVRYSFSTFSFVEYNVEDRKDARKREGRREREREETMENGRKEDEVREAERSSLGQACMVPRFASQWQVI